MQIDYAHKEIHAGNHFISGTYDAALNTGETIYLYLAAPTSENQVHCHIFAGTTGVSTFFYANPTVTDAGTSAIIVNRNLNSSKTPEMTVSANATVTATGSLLYVDFVGSDRNYGGGTRSEEEYVLKTGDTYLLRLTAGANGIRATIGIDWY